ncbi:cytidylyltransferase domain-containing protein [Parafilimonas sp.]|uniref:cytidylyltransferase domain-containing protein n=1 Tax=Parafilimonas sp. TaxID=1969739 RepID=UPI0039E4821E
MKSVAILPLRKSSKGIPGKNKKKLLGRPLYQWVLGEAIQSNIDEVYVFTDDDELIESINSIYHWTNKVRTFRRSDESATDTASTELGMFELAKALKYNFDIFCLLQATSPLLTHTDINLVIERVVSGEADSALTVVNTKRFIWSPRGKSLNYDYLERPRRQDFDGMSIENGAVYAIKKEVYQQTNNRLGGRIGLVEMPEDTLYEIDELSDWVIVEEIIKERLRKFKQPFDRIRALVLDVDGVFTAGTLAVSADGEFSKTFSLRDGMGLEIARENGLNIIVMTSELSAVVDQRMKKLEIDHYYKWTKDKYTFLSLLCSQLGYARNQLAYIGDDINDLANLLSVGWGMAPRDAVNEVKSQVDYLLHAKGGDKAIREGVDFILKMNTRF